MALPYSTLTPTEEVIVAGLPLKKRGCLTVAEMQAAANLDAGTKEELKELTPLQADIFLKQQVVTILIKSRLDRSWTYEQTCADEWDVVIDGKVQQIEPDMVMINDLFDFFMNEQRRWATQEEKSEETPGKKQTGRKSTGS
jgi:hypothetical protein